MDSIKLSILEKINRLEQDRNNDFSSELWIGKVKRKISTNSRDIFGEKKKKPSIVVGPYIVYMLHDVDIMEDYTAIKKAAVAPRRKPFTGESVLAY
jgi:breast cancer metastasis-suppressor 1-like protein